MNADELKETADQAEELKELLEEIEAKSEELDLDETIEQAEELNDLLEEIKEKLEALGGGRTRSLTVLTPDKKRVVQCTHFECYEQGDGRCGINGGDRNSNMSLARYPDIASAQAELKNLFDALKNDVGFYEMQ